MMNRLHCIASIVAMAGTVGIVSAQPERRDRTQPEPRRQVDDHRRDGKDYSESDRQKHQETMLVRSTRVEGVSVTGSDDVRLGTVKDVIVRGSSGRVVYVLVSKGTEPSYDRVVAVPFAAFRWDDQRKALTIPMNEEQFRAASSIEDREWRTLATPAQANAAYSYFKVPDDRANEDRQALRVNRLGNDRKWDDKREGHSKNEDERSRWDEDDKREKNPKHEDDRRRAEEDAKRDRNPKHEDERRRAEEDAKRDRNPKNEDERRRAEGDAGRDMNPTQQEEQRRRAGEPARGSAAQEGFLFRVGEIRNKPILGKDAGEIGRVSDVVFDAPSGRIAFLVINPSSAMNAGTGNVGVPWPMFEVDQGGRLIALEMDKEALRSAPRLTQTDWVEIQNDGYLEEMYQRFGYDSTQWNRGAARTSARNNDWQKPYRTALASGTSRTVTGKVESIEECSGKDGNTGVMIVNVRMDNGEVVAVHTAPQANLDEQKMALREGDVVTVRGKMVEIDGKRCLCATEVSMADGRRVVLHPADSDSR